MLWVNFLFSISLLWLCQVALFNGKRALLVNKKTVLAKIEAALATFAPQSK